MKYSEALATVMGEALADPRVLLLGQGVTDFKGIWGTTEGLATQYPDRVIETPLSEDSVAGICLGASLNGMYPINTHIRADFGLLIFNQLINLIAKYKYMFGGLFEIPMMFRMVIGRSWGQGAQHSQSLQSLLGHIPGLQVLMPATSGSVIRAFRHVIQNVRGPVVIFEHRLLYELDFDIEKNPQNEINPIGTYVIREGADLTIVATSVMVLEALRAANHLSSMGISAEIIDLNSISHPDHDILIKSIAKTRRLLIADTSWAPYGVSAEISRIVLSADPKLLLKPVKFLGMAPAPCPTSKALEDMFYPTVRDIVEASLDLVGTHISSQDLPPNQSMTDFYKHFKGPF